MKRGGRFPAERAGPEAPLLPRSPILPSLSSLRTFQLCSFLPCGSSEQRAMLPPLIPERQRPIFISIERECCVDIDVFFAGKSLNHLLFLCVAEHHERERPSQNCSQPHYSYYCTYNSIRGSLLRPPPAAPDDACQEIS